MRRFSRITRKRLDTCHPDLIKVAEKVLEICPVDFGISQGHRTVEQQFEFYKRGRSLQGGRWVKTGPTITNVDGKKRKSKHNYIPSLALDFYAYIPGKKNLAFDKIHLTAIGIAFIVVGEMLYESGQISYKIRWGGNWDKDGELLTDQSFDDLPHVELYKP